MNRGKQSYIEFHSFRAVHASCESQTHKADGKCLHFVSVRLAVKTHVAMVMELLTSRQETIKSLSKSRSTL